MQIVLEVIEGPHRGQQFSFDGHDNFIVGRARCAHFRLPKKDPYFSRVHFMVEVNPPCCRLTDSGSTNGTWVNGRRVETSDLTDGDLIQGGDTVLRVSFLDAPEETEPYHSGLTERPGPPPLPTPLRKIPEMSVAPPGVEDEEGEPLPRVAGYRVIRPLGRGGMGVVYLATRLEDGAQVALKTIRPTVAQSDREVQRFLREADILRKLQHPKIVAFHGMGQTDDSLYFVMDYVPGVDAAHLLARQGPLPVARAVRLICDTLEALAHAHGLGFVHRDVKPANLLVTEGQGREVSKLADFGLARVYHASPMSGLTIMGDTGGTVPYMSPEQITDYRNVSPAADQYSTAATLYRLLSGRFLFDLDDVPKQHQLTQVLFDPPVPLQDRRQDVPEALARAIHRALEKKPEARFRAAAALHKALRPFAG